MGIVRKSYLNKAIFRGREVWGKACVYSVFLDKHPPPFFFLFREAIGHMKEGEEEKTKSYSALIWTNNTIQKKDIEFLNDIKVVKCSLSHFLIAYKRVLSLLVYY